MRPALRHILPATLPSAVILALLLLASPTTKAQETPAPGAAAQTEAVSAQDLLAERMQAATEELERAREQIAAAGASPSEHIVQVERLLDRLTLQLQELSVTRQQLEEARSNLGDLQGSLEDLKLSGPSEQPPYSVLLLDSIRNELETMRGRAETLEAGVSAATQAREEAQTSLAQREAARRRAKEASESNTNAARSADLAQALRAAELESRLGAVQLELRDVELARQRVLKEIQDARLALLTERDRWVARDSVFSADDLRTKLIELEAKEEQLRVQLDLQQRRVPQLESQWLEARNRLEDSQGDGVLAEEVAARRLALQVRQQEITLLNRRLQRLSSMQDLWRRRFDVWRGAADRTSLAQWDQEARALLESLDSEFRLQQLELRDLRQGLASLQGRLEALPPDTPELARWIREQVRHTNELDQLYETNATSIDGARLVAEHLLDDITGEVTQVSWGERLARVWAAAKYVWQSELTNVDDRPITVGKIVIGLAMLLGGVLVARLVSGWLARRLLPRLGMNEGGAAAIRSIVFYLLIVTFIFIALRTINVPLTAFTILGGAVAIGVGFGSQNIMNNFMSGLILIAERPIRVGDLIQVESLYGIVQHIGARSTRVLTGDNVEIVVPNSSFLENNVVNWTLSETKVRVFVSVGVAYGSPTREVSKLLQRAVEEHGRTLKSPAPIVLFTEFGDNSLNFEVHFWIVMRRLMERRTIESDIRFRIDGLFREAGIVIAFPQRDVHIDMPGPLDVRLMHADGQTNPGE